MIVASKPKDSVNCKAKGIEQHTNTFYVRFMFRSIWLYLAVVYLDKGCVIDFSWPKWLCLFGHIKKKKKKKQKKIIDRASCKTEEVKSLFLCKNHSGLSNWCVIDYIISNRLVTFHFATIFVKLLHYNFTILFFKQYELVIFCQ